MMSISGDIDIYWEVDVTYEELYEELIYEYIENS
jgi:hypothetical protein